MSDHGFGPLTGLFHVNTFLASRGYLTFDRQKLGRLREMEKRRGRLKRWIRRADALDLWGRLAPKMLRGPKRLKNYAFLNCVDWSRTRAYAFSNTEQGIHINVRGARPFGIVNPGTEHIRVREEVAAALREVKCPHTDEPLATEIRFREEIYEGPCKDDAADILFALRGGEYVADVQPTDSLFTDPVWHTGSGTHRPDGILLARGPGVRRGCELAGAGLADLAPTILYALGLPVPEDMDGRVLGAMFTETSFSRREIRFEKPLPSPGRGPRGTDFSAEDSADLENRLRDLGYL
jgi:predicted AlkP superfamily phosphohydrolase/phosphomutase